MNNKIYAFCIAAIFCALVHGNLNGQSNHSDEELKNMTLKERMYFGGGLGASFGTITYVALMPVVGYRIMHRWSAGVGINYQYLSDNNVPSYDTHIYGGNVHTRVYIWEQLFAHGEFEILNLENYNRFEDRFQRYNVPALFVGAGYFMPFGARSGVGITFLYDVIGDTHSPYPNNFTMRIGVAF